MREFRGCRFVRLAWDWDKNPDHLWALNWNLSSHGGTQTWSKSFIGCSYNRRSLDGRGRCNASAPSLSSAVVTLATAALS